MTKEKLQEVLTENSLEFPNNQILQQLVGSHNTNLTRLEKQLSIRLSLRGNIITLKGDTTALTQAEEVLKNLYKSIQNGQELTPLKVDDHVSKAKDFKGEIKLKLKTESKTIFPRTQNQASFIKLLQEKDLVLATGPAGTGKTYMAVAMGVSMLMSGQVERLVLSRPAIEAGEKLGFLPGDMKEKVDPYLRPIYDALHDMCHQSNIERLVTSGSIEVAPLAFMRGRTLSHSYIILDEAQNTTSMQMKMFLTRLGEGSRMVVTGDVTQIDLPVAEKSGLIDALERLKKIDSLGIMEFQEQDVIRHPLVRRIVKAYAQ